MTTVTGTVVAAGGGRPYGTAMPASFDPASYGTATTYVPLVGVS